MLKDRLRRLLVGCIAIGFFCLQAEASYEEKEIEQYILTNVGPIVERKDSPQLYRTLGEIFARLSDAQKEIASQSGVSMNRVYIIDSPIVNAFVIPDKEVGKHRSFNRVFLTTAVLKKMINIPLSYINNPNVDQIQYVYQEVAMGLLRITGIMAHELGHPLDNMNVEGLAFHDHYNKEASQAIEIRADIDGARIAEKAGFSADAVYLGLKRLFGKDTGSSLGDTIFASAQTHPQRGVRLSSQKLYLTHKRYEEGAIIESTPWPTHNIDMDSFVSELHANDTYIKYWRYAEPTSLREAVQRLGYIESSKLKKSTSKMVIERNRLVLSIDNWIADKESSGENYSSDEVELLKEYKTLLGNFVGTKQLWNQAKLKWNLGGKKISGSVTESPSHFYFLRKLKFYDEVKLSFSIRTANYLFKQLNQDSFTRMNPSLGVKTIVQQIATLKSVFRPRVWANAFEEIKNPEMLLIMESEFFSSYWGTLNSLSKQRFLLGDSLLSISNFPFGRSDGRFDSDNPKKSIEVWRRWVLEARNGDEQAMLRVKSYRRYMQHFVDDSVFYALMESTYLKANIDWGYIANILEIDRDLLLQDIRQKVKQAYKTYSFDKSANLGPLGQILKNQKQIYKLISEQNRYRWSTKSILMPMWMNDSMKNFLVARSYDFEKDNSRYDTGDVIRANLIVGDNVRSMELYKKGLREILNEKGVHGVADPFKLHFMTIRKIVGNTHNYEIAAESGELPLEQVRALKEFNANSEFVKEWLIAVFMDTEYLINSELKYIENDGRRDTKYHLYDSLGSFTTEKAWYESPDSTIMREIFSLLKEYKVITSVRSFVQIKKQDLWHDSKHYGLLRKMYDVVIEEMQLEHQQSKDKTQVILDYARLIYPTYLKRTGDSLDNVHEMRQIKAALFELASQTDLDIKTKHQVFTLLTRSGGTIESDLYFRKNLMEEIVKPQYTRLLTRMLKEERIHNRSLVLELAQAVLRPRLEELNKAGHDHIDIHEWLHDLNTMAKGDSFSKDEFLEELAWRLKLVEQPLSNFIEDEKSYNWRKANPTYVSMGSTVSSVISNLSEEMRYQFIFFMQNPDKNQQALDYITDQIQRQVMNQLVKQLGKLSLDQLPIREQGKVQEQAKSAALKARSEIEKMVYNSSPFERLPIYELLLTSGPKALENSIDYPGYFIERVLKYEPNSVEENLLLAFLTIVPEHERSISMAYLLSQSGEDKSDVKQLFKIFQSVGIKFGQLASIWNIFDEEITQQIKELKDDAGAMSKYQIIEAAKKYLEKEEFDRIEEWVKILGSASMKTVALVKLKNGQYRAVLVQNPNVEKQIQSNLELSEKFISEIEKRGVEQTSALFDGLVKALKIQIVDETKMVLEGKKIQKASELLEKISSQINMMGWKFNVPQVDESFNKHEQIMFLQVANGKPFNQLGRAEQVQVGQIIVESSLQMFFKYGFFEPDRHTGNQIIDSDTKTIYMIDFGQLEKFNMSNMRQDDRLTVAQFMQAFGEQNTDGLLRSGLKMADLDSRHIENSDLILSRLYQALSSEKSDSERLTDIVEVFSEHHINIEKRFMFGALKGLMVLFGENYVSQDQFQKILTKKIKRLYLTKGPQLVWDFLVARVRKGLESAKTIFKQNGRQSDNVIGPTFSRPQVSGVGVCRQAFH